MTVLFDIDALSIYMADGQEYSEISMMISIHNMFTLSAQLSISAPTKEIIFVTSIVIYLVVMLAALLGCSLFY